MADGTVFFTCSYNGKLTIGANNEPKYVGGMVKAFMAKKSFTYDELISEIYQVIEIDPQMHRINLVCRWPITDQRYSAVSITNDRDTRTMFCLGDKQQSIEVYVEKDPLNYIQVSKPQRVFSRILDSGIDSADFIYPTQEVPHAHENVRGSSFNPHGLGFNNLVNDSRGCESIRMQVPPTGFNSSHYQKPQIVSAPSPYNMDCTQTRHSSGMRSVGIGSSSAMPFDNLGISTVNSDEGNVSSRSSMVPPLSDHSVELNRTGNEKLQENSIGYANMANEEDNQWIGDKYIDNSCIEFEDALLNEVQDKDQITKHAMENVKNVPNTVIARQNDNDDFNVGDKFESKAKLIQVISLWSIKQGVTFKPIKSNKTCYNVVCALNQSQIKGVYEGNANCPWRLYAAVGKKTNGYFIITKVGEAHTCSNPTSQTDHRHVLTSIICNLIMPIIRTKLDLTPRDIVDMVHSALFIRISYMKAWSARTMALTRLFRDWEKSYEKLPQYLDAIQRSNPGTVYKITYDTINPEVVRFTSVFWAFGPSIEGFKHCRPVLTIDSTQLYGKYNGSLLVATGIDADGGLFPLAFAVVNTENTENWEWFFACIYQFTVRQPRKITFISDWMKGIPTALKRGWPVPHCHRYCLKHVRDNFKKVHKDPALQYMLWQAGCAYDDLTYKEIMEQLKATSNSAHGWIETSLGKHSEQHWTMSKDDGKRFCTMTTNSLQIFNVMLKGAGAFPIHALVARTFFRLNKYFVKRRENANKWQSQLTPENEKIIKSRATEARLYCISRFAEDEWKVLDKNRRVYDVKIQGDKMKCTCNIPLSQHLPCSHVIAASSNEEGGANLAYMSFCSNWYTMVQYRLAYHALFHSTGDERYWKPYDKPRVLPPISKRQVD